MGRNWPGWETNAWPLQIERTQWASISDQVPVLRTRWEQAVPSQLPWNKIPAPCHILPRPWAGPVPLTFPLLSSGTGMLSTCYCLRQDALTLAACWSDSGSVSRLRGHGTASETLPGPRPCKPGPLHLSASPSRWSDSCQVHTAIVMGILTGLTCVMLVPPLEVVPWAVALPIWFSAGPDRLGSSINILGWMDTVSQWLNTCEWRPHWG